MNHLLTSATIPSVKDALTVSPKMRMIYVKSPSTACYLHNGAFVYNMCHTPTHSKN